jgi:biopolymer transport protein ExbB
MDRLLEILSDGGPIVIVLIVLSLVSLALIVVKLVQLRSVLRGEKVRDAAIQSWSKGERKSAIGVVRTGVSPIDRILMTAMNGLDQNQPRAALEAELEWRGNAEIAEMNRGIRLLELIAMISPLLGLLGTVLGMIQSFQELALAEGAANASVLAAGIWQALLTTAAGLIVAIPAAIAATLLSGRVEGVAQRIEAAVGRLFAIEDGRR